MKELVEYILQFGSLNKQQIDLVTSKAKELQLRKDEYFSEAEKIAKQVGFVVEGVLRGCYYDNQGEEITRCFIVENNLVADYVNFEANTAFSEYIQACTDCKLVVLKGIQAAFLNTTIRLLNTFKVADYLNFEL